MAHFAKLNEENIVTQVIVVDNKDILDENGQESEQKGIEFCANLLGGTWMQTSYNASFRKNYAGKGYSYNQDLDAFIPPKPYNSWILNETTYKWDAPTPYPTDGGRYNWNEETLSWDAVTPLIPIYIG
jgi:hypothetical protein